MDNQERKLTPGAAAALSGAAPVAHLPPSRPAWVEPGEWSWVSFTAGDYAEQTVIRVATKRGNYQHLITLDWGDYGDRDYAEDLAKWIVDRMNR